MVPTNPLVVLLATDFLNSHPTLGIAEFCQDDDGSAPEFPGFNQPEGITIDFNGDLVIADSKNSRIQIFDFKGNVLRMWGQDGPEESASPPFPSSFSEPDPPTL